MPFGPLVHCWRLHSGSFDATTLTFEFMSLAVPTSGLVCIQVIAGKERLPELEIKSLAPMRELRLVQRQDFH